MAPEGRRRHPARRLARALPAVVALLAAGCSGGPSAAPPASTAPAAPAASPAPAPDVVPAAWLDAAARAWPGSDGRRDGIMTFGGARECALGEQPVRLLDLELRWSGAGYGPFTGSADGTNGGRHVTGAPADTFVHQCELSVVRTAGNAHERAAGDVVLTRYPDGAALDAALAAFRSQPDTPVQDNRNARVTSGGAPVDTLTRWYPTNPQGLYQAVLVDEAQRATLTLEVNSLSRQDFDATSAQGVADALTDFVARSRSAPVPAPTLVPDWAGSVWADAAGTFHLAVAKGWVQDPPAPPGSLIALPRFVNADRSASVLVMPLHPDHPEALPDLVQRGRAATSQQGWTVVGDAPMTLDDGRPAHRFDLTRGDRRLTEVPVVAGPNSFLISAGAPAGRWAATQADMLRMVGSFVAES